MSTSIVLQFWIDVDVYISFKEPQLP